MAENRIVRTWSNQRMRRQKLRESEPDQPRAIAPTSVNVAKGRRTQRRRNYQQSHWEVNQEGMASANRLKKHILKFRLSHNSSFAATSGVYRERRIQRSGREGHARKEPFLAWLWRHALQECLESPRVFGRPPPQNRSYRHGLRSISSL